MGVRTTPGHPVCTTRRLRGFLLSLFRLTRAGRVRRSLGRVRAHSSDFIRRECDPRGKGHPLSSIRVPKGGVCAGNPNLRGWN